MKLKCPACDSEHIVTEEYHFGMDPETGYWDLGIHAWCLKCGLEGEAEDFLSEGSEEES